MNLVILSLRYSNGMGNTVSSTNHNPMVQPIGHHQSALTPRFPFWPWLALSRSQRFVCSRIVDLGEAIAVVIVQTVENLWSKVSSQELCSGHCTSLIEFMYVYVSYMIWLVVSSHLKNMRLKNGDHHHPKISQMWFFNMVKINDNPFPRS